MYKTKQLDLNLPIKDSVDGMAFEVLCGLRETWLTYGNDKGRKEQARAIIQRLHGAYKMRTKGKPARMPGDLIPPVMDAMRRVAALALDAYRKFEHRARNKGQGRAHRRTLQEAKDAAIQVLIEEFIKPQLRDQSPKEWRTEAYRRFGFIQWNRRVDGIATQLGSCIYGLAPGSIAKSKYRTKRVDRIPRRARGA